MTVNPSPGRADVPSGLWRHEHICARIHLCTLRHMCMHMHTYTNKQIIKYLMWELEVSEITQCFKVSAINPEDLQSLLRLTWSKKKT